jgi:hypothetical protein
MDFDNHSVASSNNDALFGANFEAEGGENEGEEEVNVGLQNHQNADDQIAAQDGADPHQDGNVGWAGLEDQNMAAPIARARVHQDPAANQGAQRQNAVQGGNVPLQNAHHHQAARHAQNHQNAAAHHAQGHRNHAANPARLQNAPAARGQNAANHGQQNAGPANIQGQNALQDQGRNVRPRQFAVDIQDLCLHEPHMKATNEETAFNDRKSITTLSDLINKKAMITAGKIFPCVVMTVKAKIDNANKGGGYKMSYNTMSGRGQTGVGMSNKHDRVTVCMDLNSSTGECFLLLHGKDTYKGMFHKHNNAKKDGMFRPGAIIAFEAPKTIAKVSNDGKSLPILECTKPMRIVNDAEFRFPSIRISGGNNMSGFIIHGTSIVITSLDFHNTKCGGAYCDKQNLVNGSEVKGTCPCYENLNRSNDVAASCDLLISFPENQVGEDIFINDFTSQKWFSQFLKEGVITQNTTKEKLDEVYDTLQEKMNERMRYINERGGHTIVGWCKLYVSFTSSLSVYHHVSYFFLFFFVSNCFR